jgi:protein-tyrosine phosphatase
MALVIAELACAGGRLAIAPLPGRGGAFDADLGDLIRWGPDMVISMTTAEEMAARGADALGAEMAGRGTPWHHLPVTDYGTPEGDTAARWPAVADDALATLRRGGRVLVHCMGGCGRSGMVALRLMVMAGEDPAAALTRLRAERPCAVETEAQFIWASDATTTDQL